jgi:hypothetical protein
MVAVGPISLGACTTTSGSPPVGPPVCTNFSGFALSLVANAKGSATPVAAAESFAAHPAVPNIPRSGWQEVSRDTQGATVYSGKVILHEVQGSDHSWLVDSGKRCH